MTHPNTYNYHFFNAKQSPNLITRQESCDFKAKINKLREVVYLYG